MPDIDFTSAYRDATHGSTIKALGQRRAELQAALAQHRMPQINSPWQGAAEVAGSISGAIREGRLANQEAAGRQRFAELLAGGLAPDEIGEAMGLDPETAMKYQERTWAKEDTDAATKAREAELLRGHGWDVEKQTAEVEARRAEQEAQDKAAAARQDDQQAAAITLADHNATIEEKQHAQEVIDNANTATKLAETQKTQAENTAAIEDPVAKVKLAMQAGRLTPEEGQARIDAINLKTRMDAQSAGGKKRDTDFATDANDWQAGGQQRLATNLAQVQKSIDLLQEPGTLSKIPVVGGALQTASDYIGLGKTGGLTNMLPESVQPLVNEKGIIARDSIRSAVQESLKAVLGTQFAAIEGENLMDRAFSMSLGVEENASRAKIIMNQLSSMAKNKQAMVDYYTAHNQSLEGYTGPRIDVDSVLNNMRSMADSTPEAAGGGGTTEAAPDISTMSDDELRAIAAGGNR